jgi:hypothetical protein
MKTTKTSTAINFLQEKKVDLIERTITLSKKLYQDKMEAHATNGMQQFLSKYETKKKRDVIQYYITLSFLATSFIAFAIYFSI